MAMNRSTVSPISHSSLSAIIESAFSWLDRVPYSLLALPLRLAVATVFWNSAMSHLANWQTTIELFETDYSLPFLPPDLAAYMAVSIEVSTPILLVVGLLTRATAFILFGMTTVIEVFVYPEAWPTHIQWVAMLLVLLCRGAGTFSMDQAIRRRFFSGE
jgi:putative oxidoreductase